MNKMKMKIIIIIHAVWNDVVQYVSNVVRPKILSWATQNFTLDVRN